MKNDEIERALVLFYVSRNAHGWSNYSLPVRKVSEFCRVPAAKAEFVASLRRMADHIEKDFPGYPGIRDDHAWDSDPAHEGSCSRCGQSYRDCYSKPCPLAGIDVSGVA